MHIAQLSVQVVFVHCEVVSCKQIALMACVDAPQIHTLIDVISMCKHLLVVCSVLSFELHVALHLSKEKAACVWCLSISSSWDFSVEKVPKNWNLRPGQVSININVNIFPGPVFRVFRQSSLKVFKSLSKSQCQVVSAVTLSCVGVCFLANNIKRTVFRILFEIDKHSLQVVNEANLLHHFQTAHFILRVVLMQQTLDEVVVSESVACSSY